MIKKNDIFTDEVIDFGSNGEGIIKRDNLVIFIPFCIVGEIIKYKVLKVDKNAAYGKLIEIITPSPSRIAPVCPVFGKCGGCDLQHIEYEKTLDIKRENVKRCFDKIADIKFQPEQAVKSDKIFGYRNKLQLPVNRVGGEILIGFYASNSHRIIPVENCFINPPWTKTVISVFSDYFKNNGVSVFEPDSGKGDIKEITVKEIGNALIIAVVSAKRELPRAETLINALKEKFPVFSLYLNVNTKNNNVIYGDEFILLYGAAEYDSEFCGLKIKSGVKSFSQVNDNVCEKLYKTAVSFATENSPETVIDVYSGAGLMTMLLARNSKKAYGVEIVKEAVGIANSTAKLNGLSDRAISYCGKAEEIFPEIIKERSGEKSGGGSLSVVLDPPRKGCDYSVIDAVIKSGAERVVYISCMPSTLARDVGLLCGTLIYNDKKIVKSGSVSGTYKIDKIIPFDMFPETKHVETICVLSRV